MTSRIAQNFGNCSRHAAPVLFFARQLFAAERVQLVILCTASVFCGLPFGADPIELCHAVEGRIKGPFFDAQRFFRNLLYTLGETVTMQRAPSQHFQDEEIKCALQLVFVFSFFKLFPLSQAASVATLPSALFVERLPLGASWVYSDDRELRRPLASPVL
jgi:hypothetical protein